MAGFLDNPVVGMAPWIIFSLLVGPGRFELAVGLALASAVALIALGHLVNRGSSWKLLELADVVFFTSMAVIGALAGDGTLRWLETYAGEVANIALAVIAFGSMAVRMPFTIQYAREQVDPSLWHTRGFLRTNYMITGAWGIAFLVAAAAGAYGDLVLHNPNNIWTGWIIQILAIVAAVKFTVWYPDVARARAVREASGLPRAHTVGGLPGAAGGPAGADRDRGPHLRQHVVAGRRADRGGLAPDEAAQLGELSPLRQPLLTRAGRRPPTAVRGAPSRSPCAAAARTPGPCSPAP